MNPRQVTWLLSPRLREKLERLMKDHGSGVSEQDVALSLLERAVDAAAKVMAPRQLVELADVGDIMQALKR